MNDPGVRHRLVLMRHAKSDWPHGVPDHERPLSGRGRRNAKAVGRWLVQEAPRIDLVLCSSASRARQTWQIAVEALDAVPPLEVHDGLYGATPGEVLALVHERAPAACRTVLVVGHEPTMSTTVSRLADAASSPQALASVRLKYPTNGIAVLEHDAPWGEWYGTGATLTTFTVPRAGD